MNVKPGKNMKLLKKMCKLYLLLDKEQTSEDGDSVVVGSYLILGMLACRELSYIQQTAQHYPDILRLRTHHRNACFV